MSLLVVKQENNSDFFLRSVLVESGAQHTDAVFVSGLAADSYGIPQFERNGAGRQQKRWFKKRTRKKKRFQYHIGEFFFFSYHKYDQQYVGDCETEPCQDLLHQYYKTFSHVLLLRMLSYVQFYKDICFHPNTVEVNLICGAHVNGISKHFFPQKVSCYSG